MADKRAYLVCYDYGQGGVWAYLFAESKERIAREHPYLSIVDETPPWMTEEEVDRVQTIDIDRIAGTWLKAAQDEQ